MGVKMGPFSHIVHLEEKKPSEKIGQSIKENIFEKYQKSSDVMDTLSSRLPLFCGNWKKKFGGKNAVYNRRGQKASLPL